MRYYWLRQDNRVPHAVVIENLGRVKGYGEAKDGDITKLNPMSAAFVSPSALNYYPDVLDGQLFMVKGEVKSVFDLFILDLEYRNICLLDRTEDYQEFYFIPMLESVDCFSDSSETNINRSALYRLAIKADAVEGKQIFRVGKIKAQAVVVSLAVAEALLRRVPSGIQLTPVACI